MALKGREKKREAGWNILVAVLWLKNTRRIVDPTCGGVIQGV
jgi:hypothetical protein